MPVAADLDVDPSEVFAFASSRRRVPLNVSLPDLSLPRGQLPTSDFDTDLEMMSCHSGAAEYDPLRHTRRRTGQFANSIEPRLIKPNSITLAGSEPAPN